MRPTELARLLVERLGGRFSTELAMDVDAGDREIERWFLAATLFGARISAGIAIRTYRMLRDAGIATVADAEGRSLEELIDLLDRGGYARYDYRTATRLSVLAAAVRERHGGRIATLCEERPAALHGALLALPGWGETTVRLFVRELRGVWPGAVPPLDEKAAQAAGHLGLLDPSGGDPLSAVAALARRAGLDLRDLEAALVRLALAHGRRFAACPGGTRCEGLAPRRQRRPASGSA